MDHLIVLLVDQKGPSYLLPDISERFEASAYLTPHSDLVALMVLEHQTEAYNLMTQAAFKTGEALWKVSRAAGDESAEREARSALRERVEKGAERLVRHFLFVDEARLASPVRGTSEFVRDFAARGAKNAKDDSLRAFDLQTRLFKLPCSYLVQSSTFEKLPLELKREALRQLDLILTGARTRRHSSTSPQRTAGRSWRSSRSGASSPSHNPIRRARSVQLPLRRHWSANAMRLQFRDRRISGELSVAAVARNSAPLPGAAYPDCPLRVRGQAARDLWNLIKSIESAGGEVCVEPIGPPWVWRHLGRPSPRGLGRIGVIKFAGRPTDDQFIQMGGLRGVHSLHLEFTDVGDDDLRHLAGLEDLLLLDLDATKVTDAGPLHLRGLRRLQWLSLDSTNVTDKGLVNFRGMPELQSLYLDSTDVTDEGLRELSGLTGLTVIGLRGTRVTNDGMQHRRFLPNLTVLDLNATEVREEGVSELLFTDRLQKVAPTGPHDLPVSRTDSW